MEKNKVTKIWSPQIDIRNHIADAIEKGRLVSGDRMPAYASVAKQELCSINDVKNAYKILIAEGYIRKDGKKFKVIGKKRNIKTNVTEVHNEEKTTKQEIKDKKCMNITEYAYKEIMNIISELGSGSILPSQNELSKRIGCSANTAYNAIKRIMKNNEGLLEIKRIPGKGKGFVINDGKTKIESGNFYNDGNHAYETIMNIIRKMQPGEELPTQKELSEKAGCSTYTVRQTLKKIKTLGLFDHGKNTGRGERLILKNSTPTKEKINNISSSSFETKTSVHHVAKSATKIRKKKNVGMEFRIISKVPYVKVAVSQIDEHGFVIHVDEAE